MTQTLSRHEQTLLEKTSKRFTQCYDRRPSLAAIAPGRVNLIGDHTDYTDGLCLPFAIDRYVVLVAAPVDEPRITLCSSSSRDRQHIDLTERPLPTVGNWSDYIRGVIEGLAALDVPPTGLQIMIDSDLPSGAGLSSSAALEVGAAHLLLAATGKHLPTADIVSLAQQAEHRYAGVPCGTMDQFSVANGVHGALMMLDNRSLTADLVTPADEDLAFLVIDSGVKHDLSDGGYGARRADCEAAQVALGKSLRDVSVADLERAELGDVPRRRALHVVTENARVKDMVVALEHGDRELMAELMYAGHASLRDDFQNSVSEVDLLVALASDLHDEGVIGARMTGGGFGGAVIVPAIEAEVEHVAGVLTNRYAQATGINARTLVVHPSAGARSISEALNS